MWRLLFLALLLPFTCADYIPFPEPQDSEPWPTKIYRSTSLLGPTVYYTQRTADCTEDGKYTFLTPRGPGTAVRGPIIVDQSGELVWGDRGNYYASAYNLDVQTYKGRDYLTFWSGHVSDNWHGEGMIYMLNSSYNEVYKIRGPISHGAQRSPDLNEFRITRDDTALFTVYLVVGVDMSSIGGPSHGWILDCQFVEVDIETNDVLFQWSASDHFNIADFAQSRGGRGEAYEDAWDFFHLSSVDKDGQGNYLISALYTDYLTYIDGRTGDTIWRLGSESDDFKELRDTGRDSLIFPFTSPHDARWVDNDTAITVFDNASPSDSRNRGLYLVLNQSTPEMTVTLSSEYIAAPYYMAGEPKSHTQSQGSVQLLDSQNTLVSYGLNAPAWSEFDEFGNLCCHALFGHRSSFNTGSPASYRVRKHPWKGYPSTTPDLEITGDQAAVSWNGATEVAWWILEGAPGALSTSYTDQYMHSYNPNDNSTAEYNETAPNPFSRISSSKKESFETIFDLAWFSSYDHIRIRAVDVDDVHLGSTAILPYTHNPNPNPGSHIIYHPHRPSHTPKRDAGLFFAGVGTTVGLTALVYMFRRHLSILCYYCCGTFLRRRLGRYRPAGWHDDDDDDDNVDVDYRFLYPYDGYDTEAGPSEQELGLTRLPDSDSDSDGSDVEVSVLENPRLSPLTPRGDWPGNRSSRSPRSPVTPSTPSGQRQGQMLEVAGVGSSASASTGPPSRSHSENGGRPVLSRTSSMISSNSAAERAKQQ
ncbi:ASST-domain-containing protein [Aspergillus californicus]